MKRPSMIRVALLSTLVMTGLSAQPSAAHEKATKLGWEPSLLVQLAVSDLDRSIAFYTEILGFELEARIAEISWARLTFGIEDVTIGLGEKESLGSGTLSLNFGVDDIEKSRRLLEARGVEFDGPILIVPGIVKLLDFRDPDGHRIRLAEDLEGPAE